MSASPFYDREFVDPTPPPKPPKPPKPLHITGPCEAAYARGCRCPDCRAAWREGRRRRNGVKPSHLTLEVERLKRELDISEWELDAAEMNLDALREENAMLYCRLDELEPR